MAHGNGELSGLRSVDIYGELKCLFGPSVNWTVRARPRISGDLLSILLGGVSGWILTTLAWAHTCYDGHGSWLTFKEAILGMLLMQPWGCY